MGTRRYLCKMYNYHDSQTYGYKRCGILPRIEAIDLGVEWSGFGLAV
jgi:hypothetical protein